MIDQKNVKVCAYAMTVDSGLAPNPFHGICTLAVCTPNHMRANLGVGDWLVGIAGKRIRSRLGNPGQWRMIYAMKISERLDLDAYYNEATFKSKIPKLSGSRVEMCGDNFYCRTSDGLKHTRQTTHHVDLEKQDANGDRVFVGEDFYYFGSQAVELPQHEMWSKLIIKKFKNCAVGLRSYP